MNQNDDAVFAPDDGTPLHALAELRRAMGDRYDKASGEVLHAVDRAHSAVIQADSAKTAQEEMRHLIRALATVSEVFILTPKKIQETYRDVLERLQRQVETLATAIPAMPPTPNQLAERIVATSERVDTFLSRCERKVGGIEKDLSAEITRLTDHLSQAAAAVASEARTAAAVRRRHDVWLLGVGLILGLLLGAYLWRTSADTGARARVGIGQAGSERHYALSTPSTLGRGGMSGGTLLRPRPVKSRQLLDRPPRHPQRRDQRTRPSRAATFTGRTGRCNNQAPRTWCLTGQA